jgi:hypothetical protein
MVAITLGALTSMARDADLEIGLVLLNGSRSMRARPRTEVGFVAAFVLDGIGALARAWKPHLDPLGLSLDICGVFCHGTPQVIFRNGRCELADLLVVIDRHDTGALVRRATLVQAKMARAAHRVSLSGPSSIKQLGLYQHWPSFSFADVSSYGTDTYTLSGSGHGEAGTFGVIDRHLRDPATDPPLWTQHLPDPEPEEVDGQPELGTFLTRMCDGDVASGREAPQAPKDDWSKVVELLLSRTYAKTFGHKLTLGPQRPRRGASAFMLVGGNARTLFRAETVGAIPPGRLTPDLLPDREGSGLSVLHLAIGPREE